jgi:hypothetical protein
VSPAWLEAVAWVSKKVHVDLPRDVIKGSLGFDPSASVDREYEVTLYDYYGRPKYWVQAPSFELSVLRRDVTGGCNDGSTD